MAPSESPAFLPPGFDTSAAALFPCGECGVAIVNVERHTAWHAGSDGADLRGEILGFLDSVDPAALSGAALERDPDDPIAAALAILKDQVASLP